ncbi:QA-SNARE, putative [Bodo saltans]|uniref:QA-SNARE, putative n=1 Tax=Bodo saltans TaxID=75058 RepID=A0A0S4IUA5_BODSA|nr:QA-SNARE, putative [Bodo saltans]|eukprot:CUF94825.1 QA-SNARE, putative [Bodo saltans]
MSEIGLLDGEIKQVVSALQEQVHIVARARTLPEMKNLERDTHVIVKTLKKQLTAFHSEVKKIADSTQRSRYEGKHQAYEAKVKDLEKELRTQIDPPPKSVSEKHMEDLMGEGGPDGSGFKTTDQVLRAGIRIQNDA